MGSSQSLPAGMPTTKENYVYRGGVLRNASPVQPPQPILVNRSEYGIQVQLGIGQDRLMAAPVHPSFLTLQGVPHLLGQVP